MPGPPEVRNFALRSTTARFDNQVAVARTTGTGTVSWQVPFDHTGTVDVQTGTWEHRVNSPLDGTFTIADGATLLFAAGTHTLTSGFETSGAGSVQLANATVYVNAPDTVTLRQIETDGGTNSFFAIDPQMASGLF